jgi:transposase
MKPSYEQLEQLVLELQKTIKVLEAKVADLESRLNKNPRNSSKPPSACPKPNQPKKDPAEKRSAHHPGVGRQPLPDGMVTSREKRGIKICPGCQSLMEPTGKSTKWQQVDLPELKPLVHEIELVTCKCTKCALVKTPELQAHEVYLMGPRLEGFVNVLMAQFRHSHLAVRAFIKLLIPGLHISQGLVSKAKKRAANAFDQATGQLIEELLTSKEFKHVDFTGWRHQGQNWNALIIRNPVTVCYFLPQRQNGKVLAEILNNASHKLVCDRGLAVQEVDMEKLQYCLAHLLRNIQGMAENALITDKETQTLGEVYETLQMLFHDKHRYDKDDIGLGTLRHYSYKKWAWIREQFENLLGSTLCKKLRRFCKRVIGDWKHFMVYLAQAGPMTNNLAEEGLRNLVIARKLCFGSRSIYGLKWREKIHSCLETLKRQGKSVMDFFAETIRAFRTSTPCPRIV